jgi:predicted PurR-regulated permease PerM
VVRLLLLASLLATAIEPIVNRLRRGPFTRGSGVLVVYSVIVAVLGGAIYFTIPTLTSQAAAFSDALPDKFQALQDYAQGLPRPLREPVLRSLAQASESVRAPEAPAQNQIVEAGATAARSVFDFLTVFVLAFYWMVERLSIKRVVLRLLGLRRARDVNLIWMEVEEKLGGWVRGQLVLMLAIGVMAGVGFALMGLPGPILLGVAAALFEIIPMIGPFLAFAPAVLVALSIEPSKALIVVAYAFVIQQLESNVLVPRIMRHAVGLSPLTVLTGILAGAALAGLPGAFLAVPLAGAIQVIFSHVLEVESSGQVEAHVESTGAQPSS